MRKDIYLTTFVLRGKNRRVIMVILKDGIKTQAEIHKTTKIYRTHVRRCLNQLEAKNLVKCLNPKDRIYKLYSLTPVGRRVLKKIKNINR